MTYDRRAGQKTAEADLEKLIRDMGQINQDLSRILKQVRDQAYSTTDRSELEKLYHISSIGSSIYSTGNGFWQLQDRISSQIKKLEAEAMKAKGVRFDLTPDDLELYSSEPGAKEAARAISTALTKAAKELIAKLEKLKAPYYDDDRDASKVRTMIHEALNKHVYPVMSEYPSQGASDSEPRYQVRHQLVSLAKGILGADRFSRIGD